MASKVFAAISRRASYLKATEWPLQNHPRKVVRTSLNRVSVEVVISPTTTGIDNEGMPFGLQIIGPFRGDLATLATARALERVFNTPRLCAGHVLI